MEFHWLYLHWNSNLIVAVLIIVLVVALLVASKMVIRRRIASMLDRWRKLSRK
jgi:hypothetical protein